MAQIHEAMVAIVREIGAITKARKNQSQGYQFRGIDDICNEIHPLIKLHGVYITPQVTDVKREQHTSAKGAALFYTVLTMRFIFTASDGSASEPIITVGEGMDSGDKATNKAMSAAFKYALIQAFAIPTEDLKDPEWDDHEVRPPARTPGTRSPDDALPQWATPNWRELTTPKGRKLGSMPFKDLLEAELNLSSRAERTKSEEYWRVAFLTASWSQFMTSPYKEQVNEMANLLENGGHLPDEQAVLSDAINRIQAWTTE